MKFVVSIMLLSLLLIGVLVAVAYICNRLNIGTQTNAQVTPAVPVNPLGLYSAHQNGYEYFGQLLWRCIQAIQNKCGLDCPSYVSGIYAEDINVRVDYEQGRLVYRYEVPRKLDGLFEGGGKRIRNEDLEASKIAAAISLALPHYLSTGFAYSSSVDVFDVSRSRVRIEIIGPYRAFPVQGGFQI